MKLTSSTVRVPPALRHRVPYNGVFWLVTVGLLLAAGGFAIGVELKRTGRLVAEDARLQNHDHLKVILVLNGDELLIEKKGHRGRLRMLGIRSFDPVINEREITAFGHRSVAFLEKWVLNKEVEVVFDTPVTDVKGRYLAYLEREGIDVNRRMVEEGVSMVYTEFEVAREQSYLTAERLARENREGIWGGKKAVARIVALRREWAEARRQRSSRAPPDYLLGEGP